MKLATISSPTYNGPARISRGQAYPLAASRSGRISMLDLVCASHDQPLSRAAFQPHPVADAELEVPLRPGKIVAVGRNYRAHAQESRADIPTVPLVFAKFPSSIIGSGQTVVCDPLICSEVDFEAELAVIIGRPARNVSVSDALGHVFGYTCLNDISARDVQMADQQFVRAKSFDTFCPLGPVVVTAEEIPDPQGLRITCRVNGRLLQDDTTASMLFTVAELVSRLSAWFTLDPGDIIATGTPAGVGYHRNPRILLQDGDVVDVEIERIGRLSNPVRWLPMPKQEWSER